MKSGRYIVLLLLAAVYFSSVNGCQDSQCYRPQILPYHHWKLDGCPEDETICGGSCSQEELPETDVSPTGIKSRSLPTVDGPNGNCAVYLDRAHSDSIDFGEFANTCLTRLELCKRGLTVSVWLKIDTSLNGRTYYVSSGGQTTVSRGISILGSRNVESYGDTFVLTVHLRDLNHIWEADTSALPSNGRWAHIAFTWSEYHGLRVFIDGQLQAQHKFGTPLTTNLYQYTRLMIGRPNSVSNYFGSSGFSDLKIYYQRLEDHEIAEAFTNERFPKKLA
ncbi:adhesion G-protein coupled receptor D1-like [Antedon mediterranea]|uniref:adhesion G-protein coupled receptor D1-like n=1 Tax=Antedon mediterranea TaxID=105859 RepID=UPI003AF9042F